MAKYLDFPGLETLWAKIKSYISNKIQALDVSSVGGDGKYISAISETDGKISATATTMDTTPTANSTKAVTSGGIKTALDDKFDKYGFFGNTDGKWIGAALSVGGETEVKYWKLCSFKTGNWWTLNFVADVTNAKFDSNVFERKIIAIHGSTPGVVERALEIREGNYRLYSTRGYGNIIYYKTSGNNVTIYIKARFAANVGQFCRLVSVLNVYSISNLTWYQETTAGTQPENPVKFSLGYKTVKPAGSTSVPVYIGSDGNPTECTDDFVHDGDVTSTYSSTGTAPVNGKAVSAAINASPGSDVFYVDYGTTSFADVLSAFDNANGKKLILRVGKAGNGEYTTLYYLPLYRVQFKGNTITQFVWMLDSDAYGDAAGSNSYGAISLYKLSESGWSSSSDNVDYAKTAGEANKSGTANQLDDWNSTEGTKIAVGWDGNGIQKVTAIENSPSTMDESYHLAAYVSKNGTSVARIKDVYAKNVQVGDSIKWNGWNIVVGSTGTDPNTLYFV